MLIVWLIWRVAIATIMSFDDVDTRPKRFRGKHVVMCGSDWHTDGKLQGLRFESRIDAFMLACIESLRKAGDVPVQWVSYQDFFQEWRDAHLRILTDYYGIDPDTAEARTTSWLNTLQVVGQAIRELMPHTWENADEYIRRKATKTMFLIDIHLLVPAHVSLYAGKLRKETRDLFAKDATFGSEYRQAIRECRS